MAAVRTDWTMIWLGMCEYSIITSLVDIPFSDMLVCVTGTAVVCAGDFVS